jgi:hypothetical protein
MSDNTQTKEAHSGEVAFPSWAEEIQVFWLLAQS